MSENFKPGDVAVIDGSVYLRTSTGWLFAARNGGSWSHAEGSSADRVTSLARRLVVIDPESREDVARLVDALNETEWTFNAEHVQAALREFANPTPPKPDEPTGWLATAVDEWGTTWVRCTSSPAGSEVWAERGDLGAGIDGWISYSDLRVVRVLSEGVQP